MSRRSTSQTPRPATRPIPPPLFYRDGRLLSEVERFGTPDAKPARSVPPSTAVLPVPSRRAFEGVIGLAMFMFAIAYTLLTVTAVIGFGLLSVCVAAIARPIR